MSVGEMRATGEPRDAGERVAASEGRALDGRWTPRPGLHRVHTSPECRVAACVAEALAQAVAAGTLGPSAALVVVPDAATAATVWRALGAAEAQVRGAAEAQVRGAAEAQVRGAAEAQVRGAAEARGSGPTEPGAVAGHLGGVSVCTPPQLAAALLGTVGLEVGLAPHLAVVDRPEPPVLAALVADFWCATMARAPLDRVNGLGALSPEVLRTWARAAVAWPDARMEPEGRHADPRTGLAAALAAHTRRHWPQRLAAAGRVAPAQVFRAVQAAVDAPHPDPRRAAPATAEQPDRDPATRVAAALRARWSAVWVLDVPHLDPALWRALEPLDEAPGGRWLLGDPERGGHPIALAAWARLAGEAPWRARGDAVLPALQAATAWCFDRARVGPAADGLDGPEGAGGPEPRPGVGPEPRPPVGTPNVSPTSPLTVHWFEPEEVGGALTVAVAEAVAGRLAEAVAAGADPSACAVVAEEPAAAAALAEALQSRGLPVDHHAARDARTGPVAEALAHALTAALTRDPGQVRAVLAGPLGGWSAAALAALADDEAALNVRMAEARGWGERWAAAGVLAAVRALRADLGLDARWRHLPQGAAWRADLDHLTDLLQAQAATASLGPSALLAWFEAERAHAQEAPAPPVTRSGVAHGVAVGAAAALAAHRGDERYDLVWLPFAWRAGPPPPEPAVAVAPNGEAVIDVRGPGSHLKALQAQARAADRRRLRAGFGLAARQVHLVWGALPGCEEAPLAWLLDPEPGWPERVPAQVKRRDPAGLRAATAATLAEGAARLGCALPLVSLPAAESVAFSAVPELPTAWALPRWPEGADAALRARRRTSFSGLTHAAGPATEAHPGAVEGAAELDLGETEALDSPAGAGLERTEASTEGPAGDAAEVTLARLPRGAAVGTCIHGILERADFGAPASLAAEVVAGLDRAGVDAAWAPTLTAGLLAALQTPLDAPTSGPPLQLAAVPRADRLDELAFVLPVRPQTPVTPLALAAALAAHPGPGLPPSYPARVAALPFVPFEGHLSGSLDLVFHWRGRWGFADYKSNDLGPQVGDYTPARIEAAMIDHHYVLQAHLYAVALRRFLVARLGAAAAANAQGPACYLFLRGLHPASGPTRGLWSATLPPARLDALDALFGSTPARSGGAR